MVNSSWVGEGRAKRGLVVVGVLLSVAMVAVLNWLSVTAVFGTSCNTVDMVQVTSFKPQE